MISTTSPTEIDEIENKTINIDNAFDYDIGRYFGKNIKLNDFTKFQLLENPWIPLNTYNFVFSLHSKGGRDVKRFVGLHHLKAHHWLVLSDLYRGLYCKYCVLFSGEYGSHQSSSQQGKLVKNHLRHLQSFMVKLATLQLMRTQSIIKMQLVQVKTF